MATIRNREEWGGLGIVLEGEKRMRMDKTSKHVVLGLERVALSPRNVDEQVPWVLLHCELGRNPKCELSLGEKFVHVSRISQHDNTKNVNNRALRINSWNDV
jgi:hypothetical protein